MSKQPHIVVVEGEVTRRDQLVDYLSRQGLRFSAETGVALQRLVNRALPSRVMLDIRRPGRTDLHRQYCADRDGSAPTGAPSSTTALS